MSSFKRDDEKNLKGICFRAASDAAYRDRLKADPVTVLGEGGIAVPAGMTVTVLEYDPQRRYVLLPPLLAGAVRVDAGIGRMTFAPAVKGGA